MRKRTCRGVLAALTLTLLFDGIRPVFAGDDEDRRPVEPKRFGSGSGLIGQFFVETPRPLPAKPAGADKADKSGKAEKSERAERPSRPEAKKSSGKDSDPARPGKSGRDGMSADDDDEKPVTARPISALERAAKERAREEAVLFRRLAVCDRLLEIAMDTKDDELRVQAARLEERARVAYAQRTAHLAGAGTEQPAGLDQDEEMLDKKLKEAAERSGAERRRTSAPSGNASAARAGRHDRTPVQEDDR